jgi:hypothetical protein
MTSVGLRVVPVDPGVGLYVEIVGATVSMVMESALDAVDALPAASVCSAVMLQVPSASVPSVQEDPLVLPLMVQVTFGDPVLVAVTVTVPPASAATTVIVGVLSEVTLSVDD